MSALQVEPGSFFNVGTNTPLLSNVLITSMGGMKISPPELSIFNGQRSTAQSIGLLISNTDYINSNNDIILPGFALRKGLRVMTLVNDKVMAVRNIVD